MNSILRNINAHSIAKRLMYIYVSKLKDQINLWKQVLTSWSLVKCMLLNFNYMISLFFFFRASAQEKYYHALKKTKWISNL